jgi:hypothetical protein
VGLVFFLGWISTPPVEMELINDKLVFRIGRKAKEVVFGLDEVVDFTWGTTVSSVGTPSMRNQGSVASHGCNLYFSDGSEFHFNNDEYENFEDMRSELFRILKEKEIVDFSRFERIRKRDRSRRNKFKK